VRAAVLHSTHDLKIDKRPFPPEPARDEVKVKIEAVGLCGSEVHYYEEGRIGQHVLTGPMVIGHELGGVIVGVGPQVDPARIGEVVALEPGIPCGHCDYCQRGDYNFCEDIRFFATPPVDGGLQEYVLHPAEWTFSAGDLTTREAALVEPLSVGVYAARSVNVDSDDTVLVIGAGAVGLLSALACLARGADVTVIEVNDSRIQAGLAMGLRVIDADRTGGKSFSVVMECSGSAAGIQQAQQLVRRHGNIALIGLGNQSHMQLDGLYISQAGITVHGIFRYAHTFPDAIQVLRQYRARLHPLLDFSVSMEELPDVMRSREYLQHVKTLVTV
jgi:L-iditol 2-dehydrogenase